MEREIKELGIQEKVLFKSYMFDEMPQVYHASDVIVLPTPCETFGLPALEAMGVGTPIIACNAGAYAELVSNHENCILYEPYNKQSLYDALLEMANATNLDCLQLSIDEKKKFDVRNISIQYCNIIQRELLKVDKKN